jgi:DNA modification methylase
MSEAYRVLTNDGTVWINLGDTYGTQSGNMRNPCSSKESDFAGESIHIQQSKTIHKCLLLIPHRFAIGCIERGWIMRNDIVWAKRNAMPESVKDRFSKKHEYFFFMTKSDKYYFNLDGIASDRVTKVVLRNKASAIYGRGSGSKQFSEGYREWGDSDKGKNPGTISDFWDIPTKPTKNSHFATYNTNLIDKPIIAGCPECGVILDPFCGTATTGVRALQLNRKFIGIEGSPKHAKIAKQNISNYLNLLF